MRSGFATTVYVVTLRLPDILITVRDLPLRRRRIKDTGERKLRQLNFVGRFYSPTPTALFRLFTGPKRRARPDPARESPCPRRLRSRRSRAAHGHAACRKTPKKPAFSPAPRSPRATRSPATITRSAFSGVNAWRSPTGLRSRATPGVPRTRRRCDRPPPARCLVSSPCG